MMSWCYHRILRVPWTEKRTNMWVLDKVGEKKTLRANILSRKLNYFGHIVRHPCLEKSIMQGTVDGK